MLDDSRAVVADDEIDLFELIETLWVERLWIFLFTAVFSAGGAAYAYLATPTYEASVRLLPPTSKDVAEFSKLANANANAGFSPSEVFGRLNSTLDSSSLRRAFLQQQDVSKYFNPEGLDEARIWKGYSEAIKVSLPAKNAVFTEVKVAVSDAELSAALANRYVDLAIRQTTEALLSDANEAVSQAKEQIEEQIEGRRATYAAEVGQELNKLKLAYSVAERLGIELPLSGERVANDNETLMIDEMRRLYQKGTIALGAEIDAMQQRIDDETLIPGLVDLQRKLLLLSRIDLNQEKINVATVDLPAAVPPFASKPKKLLILALSIVLGGMLGVLFVLIRSAILKRRSVPV